MRIKLSFNIGQTTLLLKAQSFGRFDIRTGGIDSRIPETALHIPLLDYDNIVAEFGKDPETRLREELQYLQAAWEIGNSYVFWTRDNGRHALFLDAFTFRMVKDIVDSSSCDLMFKKAPQINEYRCWVLRCEKKGERDAPKFLYTVESPFEGKNLQSLSHAGYLWNYYRLKVNLKNPVGPPYFRIQRYNTSEKHIEEEKVEVIKNGKNEKDNIML